MAPGRATPELSPERRAALRREFVALRNELLVRQFRELATELAGAGIPVMPLKGILLHRLVYEHPGDRPMTDIDVLVPRDRFDEAVAVARGLGYATTADPHGLAKAGCTSERHASVDLHGQLFLPHVNGLTAAEMFCGARLDTDLLGVEVSMPAPDHLLLHILLHFAHHKLAQMQAHQEEDIRRIVAKLRPNPERVAREARRLQSCHDAYYALTAAAVAGEPELARLGAGLPVPLLLRALLRRFARTRQPAAGAARLVLSLLLLDRATSRVVSIADHLTGYRARRA